MTQSDTDRGRVEVHLQSALQLADEMAEGLLGAMINDALEVALRRSAGVGEDQNGHSARQKEAAIDRHDEAATLARSIFLLRRERGRHLPLSTLSEAGWNLLLALFIADADGRRITGAQAVEDADLTSIVGERWLMVLHKEGLAIADGEGELADVIGLTPAGLSAVEACMRDAQEHFRSVSGQERP